MRKFTREQLETFLARYRTEEEVLDVGAGGSAYDRYFPNRITVDIDAARGPNVVADAHALPFGDETFSCVLSTEMLEHVHEPAVVAKELMRVLKPDGLLILTTRFAFPLHDTPHDYWRFTTYGLQHLFANWEIVEIVPETGTLSAIAVLLQRVIFQTRMRCRPLSKGFLYLLALLLRAADKLLIREYGDIRRTAEEAPILTSGYYLVVRKRVPN